MEMENICSNGYNIKLVILLKWHHTLYITEVQGIIMRGEELWKRKLSGTWLTWLTVTSTSNKHLFPVLGAGLKRESERVRGREGAASVALFKYAISISEKYKTHPTRSSLNCAKR